MTIRDHRLLEAIWKPSPNVGGRLKKPKFIIAHWTGGHNAANTANWFSMKMSKASAHLIIGRGGELYQPVLFDAVAWHAGLSRWQNYDGLNKYSIGIELDNPGNVVRDASGKWRALHLGRTYADEDVVVDEKGRGFVTYTDVQIKLFEQIGHELIDAYPTIGDVLGHMDVSPGRKPDPGFAWPAEAVRAKLFGRA